MLEAAALQVLSARCGAEAQMDWRWLGAAIDLVDRAVPELGLASRDLGLSILS